MLASRTDAVLQALGIPLKGTPVDKKRCSQQSGAPRGDCQDPGKGRDDKTRSALVRETSRKPSEYHALGGQPLRIPSTEKFTIEEVKSPFWNIHSLRSSWDSE